MGHCEYGLGDQKTRITPDLQESGEQPGGQAKLDALAMIVHSWTILLPHHNFRIILCNLHSHVRHVSKLWLCCQQLPRCAKQIWPLDVGLGHLIVRVFFGISQTQSPLSLWTDRSEAIAEETVRVLGRERVAIAQPRVWSVGC
jgi:hypothetical protein